MSGSGRVKAKFHAEAKKNRRTPTRHSSCVNRLPSRPHAVPPRHPTVDPAQIMIKKLIKFVVALFAPSATKAFITEQKAGEIASNFLADMSKTMKADSMKACGPASVVPRVLFPSAPPPRRGAPIHSRSVPP